jgi:hypothetical protein
LEEEREELRRRKESFYSIRHPAARESQLRTDEAGASDKPVKSPMMVRIIIVTH